jgi:antitoxin component YwqK of YwqJK toxin-antitoxin module
LLAGWTLLLAVAQASAQPFVVVGQCRAGLPNGAYELRMPDGRLRVAGAFAQGHLTGTFVFWTASGARAAVVPFDSDAKNGTIALWYTPPGAGLEAGRKLEAPYVDDKPHGIQRSWYPNGGLRAEYRYEHGVLSAARAWSDTGGLLPEAEAKGMAARDAASDDEAYAALVSLVRANLPACEAEGPNGETPRS